MKVAFINCAMTGSTGMIVRHIAERLKEEGHEAIFISGHKEADDAPYSYQTNRSLFIKAMSKIRAEIDGSDGFVNNLMTKKAIKYLDGQHVDLIHLHNTHDHFINTEMIVKYASQKRIPIVWTLHDEWLASGRCCNSGDCDLWKTGCGHCPHKDYYMKTRLFDKSAFYWNKKHQLVKDGGICLVAVCDWLANKMKDASFDLPLVLNNPVDLECFKNAHPNKELLDVAAGRKVIFACASYMSPSKGLLDLIKLSEDLPEDKYVVFACGIDKGTAHIGKIHALGRTGNRELMASYYASADVFVNFTMFDTIPTVNIEALATGIPVVTYRTGGASQAINEGKNGYSVPAGNYEEAKESVIKLLNNSPMSKEECRNSVRGFDKKEASMHYLSLYKNILGL